MPRFVLILEFVALFVVLPLAYRLSPIRVPALPVPWAAAIYAWWHLLRNPQFDRNRLWSAAAIRGHIAWILVIFAAVAVEIWLAVRQFTPQLEWSSVRANPAFWALVMVLYPVLSVYPQGLLYRASFFERYAALFPGKWPMIVASALAFAFMHLVFRNVLAVALTFAGGLLFAARYAETASLATSCLAHALFGCWLFTVGLGQYFFHGTIATLVGGMRR